jgi:hypothetical protein
VQLRRRLGCCIPHHAGWMNVGDFWAVVRRSRAGAARDQDEVALVALTSALAEISDEAILEFDRTFRGIVDGLDLGELRDVADQLWVLNDDTWLYLRAWIVSKGPELVERLRRKATGLRRIALQHGGPFDAPSGEIFLYCGEYARVNRQVATT